MGIPTLPLPTEVGSYLGSNCERPYIPGLMVTFPVEDSTDLMVDAPYALRDPMRPVHPVVSERSWLGGEAAPVRDFWWGLQPFTAVQFARIEGWGALMADGFPHFFLWQNPSDSAMGRCLGLSFGASLIHPRTVTKRMRQDSEWYEFGRGPAYGDFQDGYDRYSFNHPEGTYTYRYSLTLETDPLIIWREAQELTVSPFVVVSPETKPAESEHPQTTSLLQLDAENIVLTGCEWLAEEEGLTKVRVRLVELMGRLTQATLVCHRPVRQVETCLLPISARRHGDYTVQLEIPAYGVRELILHLEMDDGNERTREEHR